MTSSPPSGSTDTNVTALTLPGLESAEADRSAITLSDHVDAICKAVTAAGAPVMLAVHSGAGVPGYAVSDRFPERLAAMVYVDSGPATGALDPDSTPPSCHCPRGGSSGGRGSLDGLGEEQLETFRAAPCPSRAPPCATPVLTNDRRLDVPDTVVCTSMTSDEIKDAVEEGYAWLGGLAELRDVTYVDLPTGHWPMWSRPQELAAVIGDVARRAPRTRRTHDAAVADDGVRHEHRLSRRARPWPISTVGLLGWMMWRKIQADRRGTQPRPGGGTGLSFQTERSFTVKPTWPARRGDQQMMLHLEIQVDDLDAALAHALAAEGDKAG